jgi:3-oxoacyl-[acyl-carrier-protein] synthase II
MRRVVVTGIGVVSPIGSDLKTFTENLRAGRSGIGPITKFDTEPFTTKIAGEVQGFNAADYVPKKEQRRMDEFCVYGIGAAKQAVSDAGLDVEAENGERIGVIIGAGIGGIQTLETQHAILRDKGPARCSPFMIPMMIIDIVSGMVAIEFGFKGPNYGVVSACASAAHALGDALNVIRRGDADVMVAGGAEASVSTLGLAGFCSLRALSTRNDDPERASRPFDKDRDGFVMADGAGLMVLEELERAKARGARIYCELGGFGMSCDAYHITAPAEDGEGAVRAMKLAMQDAGKTPDDIDYINAHGTSTQLNDKGETKAIKAAFGERAGALMISSTKSMTGHTLGAAGGVEAAVCALTIKDGVVSPTINQETPDPECDLDYVPNTSREAPVRACLSNSFGFGGHNACLLFNGID